MKEQRLAKNIEIQARKFKQRVYKSPEDGKRHDKIRQDEQEMICTAHNELGWSFAKIGSVFDRDPRAVGKAIKDHKRKEEAPVKQEPREEISHEQQAEGRERLAALIQTKSQSIAAYLREVYFESWPTDLVRQLTEPDEVHQVYLSAWRQHWVAIPTHDKVSLLMSLYEQQAKSFLGVTHQPAQERCDKAYLTFIQTFCSWLAQLEDSIELAFGLALEKDIESKEAHRIAESRNLIAHLFREEPSFWLSLRLITLGVACQLLVLGVRGQPPEAIWADEVARLRELYNNAVLTSVRVLPGRLRIMGKNRPQGIAESIWHGDSPLKLKTGPS